MINAQQRNMLKTAYDASITTTVGSILLGSIGKAGSILCNNNSISKSIFSGFSTLGIFGSVAGFGLVGVTSILKDPISDLDIAAAEFQTSVNNTSEDIKNYVNKHQGKNDITPNVNKSLSNTKLAWLEIKKSIQDFVFSAIGWNK